MTSVRVAVTKSSPVVIRPSESEPAATAAPPDDTVALSSFDRFMPPVPVTALLVFDCPIHEPSETIKRALARALAHYRPLAGRLDGRGGISCTGEGVTFVGASAGCTLEEAMAALQLMDLAVRYPGELCRDTDPLLLVQVTEFACGGFVVGVTWNHVAADGVGMAQFLQAVGELARGVSPPSVVPFRHWDGSLPSSAAVPAQAPAIEQRCLARQDITVPWSLISRIKAGGFGGGGEPCTVFEAVAAALWRCRTRAALSDDLQSPAPLIFPCNVRGHVGARAGYYGNCLAVQLVPATSCAVASSSVGDLVRLIRRAKEKVPDLLSNSGGGGGNVDAGGGEAEDPAALWYGAFAVTSWRNLGFESADFGGGTPARVVWHAEWATVPGCAVCPSCRAGRDDDGVKVSSLCVKPEHADAFLRELARMAASAE
ncbi:hypothetical protein ACP70R_022579 [Stipagrostis hirtigluma subsp. patula]